MEAQPDYSAVSVRLARNEGEVKSAQRVRYQVFYEENGAKPSAESAQQRLDFDHYDSFADHLIVTKPSQDGGEDVVGTYRLLRQSEAEKAGGFYSADEFDLTSLLDSGLSLLELGRSCVLPAYRSRPVLQMLWQGIADYITEHKIDMMFGCASLHGTDVKALSAPLTYMKHYHQQDGDICPRALPDRYVDMDQMDVTALNAKREFAALPPVIKGYFRVGGTIGDGAVIDEDFNTTDVLVMVKTDSLAQRYRSHYERKIQKEMHK